jgi:hypothetical protein
MHAAASVRWSAEHGNHQHPSHQAVSPGDPEVSWLGGAGALSFKCELDGGRWTSCRSAKVYRHLKKGRHTFKVKAVDARGKADSTPATRRFTV